MVYRRYEPPTPDMLNKAKYLPFVNAMSKTLPELINEQKGKLTDEQ